MIKKLAISLGCAALLTTTAHAQSIIGLTSVSSPEGDFGGAFALINAINQSGLSALYTSGVTDFASFVATTTHNSAGSLNSGFTGTSGGQQVFSFNIGSVQTINGLAIWANENVGSVQSFNLYADNDNDFGNGVGALLGSFSVSGPTTVSLADVESFSTVSTQYLELEATSPRGLVDGIGEIALRSASAVPEPSTYMLMATGLLSIGAFARRRRQGTDTSK